MKIERKTTSGGRGMNVEEIYKKNQRCLQLIPEIVEDFRRQCFFQGSKKMSELTGELNEIVENVLQQKKWQVDRQEMLLLLEALVAAQNNRDNILVSDILEGDLLPFLQKLQMLMQTEERIGLPEFFKTNLSLLYEENETLYQELKATQNEESSEKEETYQMAVAINGQPTLKVQLPEREFFMHSTINPQREAQILVTSVVKEEIKNYIVFGMGLGYHVMEILKQSEKIKVTVLENELQVLLKSFRYMDWSFYLKSGRLKIIYHPEIPHLMKELEKEKGAYTFFLHYPSLQGIRDEKMKEVLEDFFVATSSMLEQRKFLDENFEKIQTRGLPECSELKGIFCGKKVVIVGAGPSVDNEIEALKQYQDEVKILAVGHIARKLLQEGIVPDAIVITDPQEHMYQQIENLDTEQIPLLILSTASAKILNYYKGQAYVVYQEGYEPAEEVAGKQKYPVYQTGGSVSTLALDLAIQFKAEAIILVGLDLAYTGNHSHADGVGHKIKDVSSLRQVESTDGTKVYTSRNLDIYRKWIERRISSETEIPIYNTAHGARIHGTIEASWDEIL